MEPLNLSQLIKDPTWITKERESLIDLIMVTSASNVKTSGVVDILGANQHCISTWHMD